MTKTVLHNTIAIQNPHKKGEKIIIAEHEYDPKEHKLFGSKEESTTVIKTEDALDFSKLKSVAELKAFAATHNIALGDAASKADILKTLEAWKEQHTKEQE